VRAVCPTPLSLNARANKKPGWTTSKAGCTHPRPFSDLFLRGGKPAGSNDHGITRLLTASSLSVKVKVD
jgi:hypothetical protein